MIIVDVADELSPAELKEIDRRTREGREREVLEHIKVFGGFTVFWACESLKRAHALDRLIAQGRVVIEEKPYPHVGVRICGQARP